MNKSIFILLAILFLPLIENFGEEIIVTGSVTERKPFKGQTEDVIACLNGNSVEIEFLQNCDDVTITIENAVESVVFNNTIDVTSGLVYTIDVSNFETGWYLLRIESKYGSVVGNFFLK
jgi:hypothetical protein